MEIIDQIRQVANIVDIASQYTTLRKRGRKHVGLCPFHSEKDPSFTVDADKQLFHCFGCGVGGDIFTLIMEKENLSFPEALNHLCERYHIPLPKKTRLSPELVKLEEKVFKINEMALAFFRKSLFQTKEGEAVQDYLGQRGLSTETLEMLKVGYAPASWNALLTHLQGRGLEPSLLEKAGLAVRGQKKPDLYDRFRARLIFPIFSLTGKVVGFGGRTTTEADPKYLNSPDTPVYSKGKVLYGLNWTKEAVREAGELILVEGYTDFAALYQAGIRNIAASLGTALTLHQVALAKRFAPRLIVNYDGDAAGQNAAFRAIPICFEAGVHTRVLVLPLNLDPDAFIRKHGREAFLDLAAKSVSGLKYLIDMNLRSGQMSVPEDKARIVRSVVGEMQKMPDAIVRSEYIRQASEYLSVDEALLRQFIEKPAAGGPKEEKSVFLPAEKRLLQLLLEDQKAAAGLLGQALEEDFRGLKGEAAFRFILDCCRRRKSVLFTELAEAVGSDLSRQLSQVLVERPDRTSAEEALDCLLTLRKTSLEAKRRAIKREIDRCERSGEKSKLAGLMKEFESLTRQILSM
ncbi:MAG: DNA primase [Acidobacteriota bacterium]